MAIANNNIQPFFYSLGKKTVLWLSTINKYVVAEPLAAKIILQLTAGKTRQDIAKKIQTVSNISFDESLELIEQINRVWIENINKSTLEKAADNIDKTHPGNTVHSQKTYKINGVQFFVEYETSDAEWYNHPKFAHLEVSPTEKPHHQFRVEDSNGLLSLWVNGQNVGSWEKEYNHFLSGKFSMQIVQKIYDKKEEEWMGVFHAAGISNGKQCIMFFGDSGNGKSTLSALLMAAGFDVLSDDFLPVESKTGLVYRFPAALSIKKQAYDLVLSIYPEILNTSEYENSALNKIYRFLPPRNLALTCVPCKAIIHLKYDPKINFHIEKITPDAAFTRLVPDSWINQTPVNVGRFVKWFEQLKHYKLTYSNNEKMISTIKKMLDDE